MLNTINNFANLQFILLSQTKMFKSGNCIYIIRQYSSISVAVIFELIVNNFFLTICSKKFNMYIGLHTLSILSHNFV